MQPIQSGLDERLVRQAKRLDTLTQLVRQQLPPECDGHYHIANIRQHTLIVITDSPVWTTRLRQLAPDILNIIQQAGVSGIRHINVTSRMNYQPPKREPPPKIERNMSRGTAEILDSAADCIEDEALKHALRKLARRGRDE